MEQIARSSSFRNLVQKAASAKGGAWYKIGVSLTVTRAARPSFFLQQLTDLGCSLLLGIANEAASNTDANLSQDVYFSTYHEPLLGEYPMLPENIPTVSYGV